MATAVQPNVCRGAGWVYDVTCGHRFVDLGVRELDAKTTPYHRDCADHREWMFRRHFRFVEGANLAHSSDHPVAGDAFADAPSRIDVLADVG